jgi:hypothetical protein
MKNNLANQLKKMQARLREGRSVMEKQRRKLDELELDIKFHKLKIAAAKTSSRKPYLNH